MTGCHRHRDGETTLLGRISRAGHAAQPPKPGELAERGRAEISAECEKQSYETAGKGLIVSETGLHEDVFALRDLVSYGEIAYGLDEALRLESLLQQEVKAHGRSAEQVACIQAFDDHLEAQSDQLLEADERMKELDVSAFQDSAKQAQGQLDKNSHETQKPATPQ
jgi:hypothetical protein